VQLDGTRSARRGLRSSVGPIHNTRSLRGVPGVHNKTSPQDHHPAHLFSNMASTVMEFGRSAADIGTSAEPGSRHSITLRGTLIYRLRQAGKGSLDRYERCAEPDSVKFLNFASSASTAAAKRIQDRIGKFVEEVLDGYRLELRYVSADDREDYRRAVVDTVRANSGMLWVHYFTAFRRARNSVRGQPAGDVDFGLNVRYLSTINTTIELSLRCWYQAEAVSQPKKSKPEKQAHCSNSPPAAQLIASSSGHGKPTDRNCL
jgi:hypothetical protein